MTLEQLAVVSAPQITFDSNHSDRLTVEFTPTVPHCGMSTFIGAHPQPLLAPLPHVLTPRAAGLSIRVRLLRSLPQRFKIDIRVKPGSHQSEHARTSRPSPRPLPSALARCSRPRAGPPVNKQLNDKERVAAALENPALLEVLEQCLSTAGRAPGE